jgi:tetratricopeptide (TPR) repeat protein
MRSRWIEPRWVVVLVLVVPGLGCAASAPRRPPPSPPRGSSVADAAQAGIALYNQGRYAEAEAALAGATGPDARAYLAASRVRLRRYADAEAPALEALAARPAHEVAAAALGEALVSEGKLDEAVSRLTSVLATGGAVAYAYYWRAQAYQRLGQVARMVDDYEAFLRLAPDAPEAAAVRVLLGGLR